MAHAPLSRIEPAPRFGEFLAALSIPDFAGLPLEYWPGYRLVLREREREAPSAQLRSGTPRADGPAHAEFGRRN
jgi:hypothetical protein